MILIYALVIFTLLLIWLPWLWRYKIRPYYAKADIKKLLQEHPEGVKFSRIANLLNILYRGVKSSWMSRIERKRLNLNDDAFIYGEIEFLSFILILEKTKPQAGEVFYDLGSGAGKAVFTAALCYDLSKTCGIELLPGLFKLANTQINKAKALVHLVDKKHVETYLRRLSSVKFSNNNFLDCDLSDGNLVFINATCLSHYTWKALVQKLTGLKAGSRVITTTKRIENEHFELLYELEELMSWGMNSVYIYRKIS